MKRLIYKIKQALLVLLLVSVASSCHVLHEDMDECDLFLKFRYDYNLSYEDWFAQQVEEVKVFVFDKNNKFVDMFDATAPSLTSQNYKMKIPYHMRGYTAVVWAGRTEQHYTLPRMDAGDPIDKLTLSYNPANGASSEQIAALWHSGPHIMTFPDASATEQTISLTRNTNNFHISMQETSTAVADISNYEITIAGANGAYDHRNGFPLGIANINYTPADYASKTANVYAMRLVHGEPVTISVKDPSGNSILIGGNANADLIELLLKGKPEGMKNQEYLDRKYIWDITLNYNQDSYIAISITINGWVHWFKNTDL